MVEVRFGRGFEGHRDVVWEREGIREYSNGHLEFELRVSVSFRKLGSTALTCS